MAGQKTIGRKEWDAVAEAYSGTTENITGQFTAPLLDAVHAAAGDDLLDVACGTGAVSVEAAGRRARVTALDYSTNMLSELRRRLDEATTANVEAVHGDAGHLQFRDAVFTNAVSNFGVIFCPDVFAAISEMRRVVRPGGRIGLTAWTRPSEHLWTAYLPVDAEDRLGFELESAPHYRWQSPKEMRSELERAGLTDVQVDLHIAEGPVVRDAAVFRSFLTRSSINRASHPDLDDDQFNRLCDLAEAALEERIAVDGFVELPAPAWVAAGTVTRR